METGGEPPPRVGTPHRGRGRAPPRPQPAPTRLSRRRPGPPGAAPAAAAAPPTACVQLQPVEAGRAGPTSPERPQLRRAPRPAPGAPRSPSRLREAQAGRGQEGFPQTDARLPAGPGRRLGGKRPSRGGGRRPWNGSWLRPRPPPGTARLPQARRVRPRRGTARAGPLPPPGLGSPHPPCRHPGRHPAHLPSPALLHPPALSPASPRSSLLGAGTPPGSSSGLAHSPPQRAPPGMKAESSKSRSRGEPWDIYIYIHIHIFQINM